MDHDSHQFFQELFRDFSVVGEHFPVVPNSGKPLWDGFSSRKLTNKSSLVLVLRSRVIYGGNQRSRRF